jgi:CBS domain containing-hemolysin-like protein
MLAGAQLGITAATFALGAISEPWIHHMLVVLLDDTPLPPLASNIVAFALALFIATFLHLVVGEMAPKSWAIAHPEKALTLIARPARGFIAAFRPLLTWINTIANQLVARTGEEPVERAAAKGYDVETLQHLVEHSREQGALDATDATQIAGLIDLDVLTLGDAVSPRAVLPADASVADVHEWSRSSGHMRALIDDGTDAPHLVHVRDTLLAGPDQPARELSRPSLVLPESMTLSDALNRMRACNEQVAVVVDDREGVSVITWDDILRRLWPRIGEELDRTTGR